LLKPFKDFLKKPLSLETFILNKCLLTIFHGILVFLFLNLFKPFKLYLLKEHLFGFTILMGILTFIIPYLLFVLLEQINYKKCTFSSISLLSFCFILVYSYILWVASGIYKDINGLNKLSFFLFYKYSSSLAILSIATIIILNDIITFLKKNKYSNIKAQIFDTKQQEITIYSNNKKDKLNIHIDKLIYVSVTGNYTSFFIFNEQEIKEVVLRNTLSKIFIQLKNYPLIFKCHKSYIINTSYFDTLTGNTRGYYFESKLLSIQIPISRSFKKEELIKIIS